MNEELEKICEIRYFKLGDESFIFSTFLRGLYYGNEFFKLVPKDIFMANYKKVIESLLSRAVVKVACLKEDHDVILGYSIQSLDNTTVHWIFVKQAWRRKGIMKALIPESPTAITHFTSLGLSLLPKFKDCVFDPFKL